MNLPAHLKREFETAGGTEVAAVARALYDIEGNLGETHVVTDGRRLALYSRRMGGPVVARGLDLAEISHVEVGSDGSFLYLKLRPGLGQVGFHPQYPDLECAARNGGRCAFGAGPEGV